MKIITAFVSLNSILTVFKIFLQTEIKKINKKKICKTAKKNKKTPTSAKTNTNDVKNNGKHMVDIYLLYNEKLALFNILILFLMQLNLFIFVSSPVFREV